MLDHVLGLAELQRLYSRAERLAADAFPAGALETLGIRLEVTRAGGSVPTEGGVLVTANHPHGPLDGLAVLAALERVRTDVKVLGNGWLASVPELRDRVLAVDPFDRTSQRHANAASLRAAMKWLSHGGCVVVFPAGEVAHRVAAHDVAVDRAWHPHVAALAVRAGVPVLPVFVAGTTRRRVRLAGRVHPLLRTALLPRELIARRRSCVSITIGRLVPAPALERLPDADRAAYLQTRTMLLASAVRHREGVDAPTRLPEPLACAVHGDRLAAEIAALPMESRLVTCGGLEVYCVGAADAPVVLEEIGYLRERSFRAVGEGSGRARDLDEFDRHYRHLFAWDPKRRRIAGAYRLALTDQVVRAHGIEGLYTRTLFDFDERLLAQLGPALELGRSFVCEEYQRGFAPLLALWRGIGAFLAGHPSCRAVFGAVSISSRYDTLSRRLLVRFLQGVAQHPAAVSLVRPRRPLPPHPEHDRLLESATVLSLDGVAALVTAIEHDGKPVPVLLRQYLKLNARLLGFSVDPAFGDALDGLMVADLTAVPAAMLERIMGSDAASRLRAGLAPPVVEGQSADRRPGTRASLRSWQGPRHAATRGRSS